MDVTKLLRNYKLNNIESEPEHIHYNAYNFQMNSINYKLRQAKITPTKVGCFVALWKRSRDEKTIPYDLNDPIDIYVIIVENNQQQGQFVFPKKVLAEHNILSINKHGGKRGFRLYPLWDNPPNQQAKKTQAWQLPYFSEISNQIYL